MDACIHMMEAQPDQVLGEASYTIVADLSRARGIKAAQWTLLSLQKCIKLGVLLGTVRLMPVAMGFVD